MKLKSYTKKDRYGNMTSFEFYEGASVDMGDIPPMMEGVPDHPGNPKGTDTVPAWLTPGEFVMNAEATRMFEPQIEEMNNAGRAVQAQQGGTIPEYAASGGQMPAAKIDGDKFAKAAMAVGLPTDNATLNKLVNLVNQGMSVQEAAKRIASVPQYSANGGPVYLAEGSGGFLDNLLNMFTSSPQEPVDTSEVADPNSPLRTLSNEDLVKAAKAKIAAADPNKPADQTSVAPTMQNAAYMNLIKDTEGFKNEAYLDSAGVPTIGYGFTKGVKMGDTMDKETADKRLVQEMAVADKDYNSLVDADLNPNQQAAVKSLLYNIGGPQFANSKARAALNSGDFEAFQKEAAEFRMANGKVIPGLENRRAKELSLFNTPYVPLKDAVVNQINGVDMGQQSGSKGSGQYLDTGKGRARLADSMDPNQQDRDRNAPGIYAPAPVPELDDVVPVPVAELDSTAPIPSGLTPGSRGSGEYLDTGEGNRTPPAFNEPPKDLPDNLIFNQETGKVEFKNPATAPTTGLLTAIEGPQGARAQALKLRTAEEEIQTAIANGYGPGDPIFDGALARRDALKGADEKLADLEGQRKNIFTKGELEVTTAEVEKKQIQADELVNLGMTEEAKKVQEDVDNLKAKQQRLSDSVTDTGTDPSVNTSPVVLEDEDLDNDQQQEEAVEIAKKIIADKDFPADNTTDNQTPEAATEAGKTAPPEEVGKVESFLSGIFGDLFDSGELKRMAIMYAGSRIMGGSHAGSLNFATKQYVTRVDKKVSDHKAYVKKLTEDGTYEPKSIALYNKTKNIADLAKKGATYSNTGGSTLTKMVPITGKDGNNKGYKKATLVPVKNSITGSIDYQLPDGSVVPSVTANNLADHREEFERGSEAYKARRSRIKSDMSKRFDEVREQSGIKAPAGDGKQKEYYTNVGPEKAADQYFAWSESLGPQFDPESAEAMNILTLAQEQMIREAKDPGTKYKPSNLTKYLNFQKIRADTGAENLFLINPKQVSSKKEEPKFVRMDKMEKLYGNMDTLISQIPNNTTSRSDIFATGVSNWNKLSPKDQEQYSSKASRSAGESGFYKFMEATIPALFEALNKT